MPIPAGPDPVADPTTDLGMVRLLSADTDPDNPLLSDDELTALLAMEGGNVRLAAASSLEVIARSEALLSKKISTQNLSTDGPAVARELRESAALLRAQAVVVEDAETAEATLPLWSFPEPVSWGDSYL